MKHRPHDESVNPQPNPTSNARSASRASLDQLRTDRGIFQAVLTVGLLVLVVACVEGPPLAEVSLDSPVAVVPGESVTVHVRVEAESVGGRDEAFRAFVAQPSRAELSEMGVERQLRAEIDGVVHEGTWPERVEVEAGQPVVGDFYVTLTNEGTDPMDLVITVTARGRGEIGSEGSAERLSLSIFEP